MSAEPHLEAVIGLEVHVQLATESKLFCACAHRFGEAANTRICTVCTGHPGALPVLNEAALDLAIRAGLALRCRIQSVTHFDRKNYFYPDLPKGYQISQYDRPVAENGSLEFEMSNGERRRVHIARAHLEEDAGKILHPAGSTESLVDLNRAGVPLLEIVTAPELTSPEEAAALLSELRRTMRHAGVSDCDMEKGSMRCDANLSVRTPGDRDLGTKVEIKNLNSIKNVEQALRGEFERQSALFLSGNGAQIVQETRSFREDDGATISMRGKEGAADYRYFPDPDLPPVSIDPARIEVQRSHPFERPLERVDRFCSSYGLSDYDARVLVDERSIADWFEAVVIAGAEAKSAANWVQGELLAFLGETRRALGSLPIGPAELAALLQMVREGELSHSAGKSVFRSLLENGGSARDTAVGLDLLQIRDDQALHSAVRQVIEAETQTVADFRAGKQAALNALLGRVMKALRGKGDPVRIRELLERELGA